MGWFSQDAPSKSSDIEPTSLGGTYKPMKRSERQKCWEARDVYFGCLDKANILDAVKDSDAAAASCGKEEGLFKQDCATSWVSLLVFWITFRQSSANFAMLILLVVFRYYTSSKNELPISTGTNS